MTKIDAVLSKPAPNTFDEMQAGWPEGDERLQPSPRDCRDEVFYFLLTYRLSDGREDGRPMLTGRAL